MAIKTIKIDSFNRGLGDDVRQQENGIFSASAHIDITKNPKRMTPYTTQIKRTAVASTSTTLVSFRPENFCYSNNLFFALGRKPGIDRIGILQSNDYGATWSISSSSFDSGQTPIRDCFIPYKDNLYGIKSTATNNYGCVWSYGNLASGVKSITSPVNTFAINDLAMTYTTQGIVAKDDNLYLPYENKLSRYNGTTWANAVITLPTNELISSLANWGNYLAIATRQRNNVEGQSKVYFWDLVSPDVSEVINWGDDELYVLENFDNKLIGISSDTISLKIRAYSGGSPVVVKDIPGFSITKTSKQIKFNSLYFIASDGTQSGLCRLSKKNENYSFAFNFDRKAYGDTVTTTVNSFQFVENYLTMSADISGNTITNNVSAGYTTTATYESQKLTGDDSTKEKAIRLIAVSYVPLPSGASITCKYRVNSDSSWTTIFTDSTDNSISHEAVNIESSGAPFSDFKELQIRLECTGFAEPTSIKVIYEEVDSQLEV